MKKLIVALIACGVTYGALAQVTQTSEAVDVFTPPHEFRDVIIAAHNKVVADLAGLVEGQVVVETDDAANVVLTTKTPADGALLHVLYTPNSTNVVEVVDSEAHTITTLRRVSLNFGGTTNDWIEVIVDAQ